MMKVHCDNCDALMPDPSAHLWANKLEARHPLRSVTAKIQFFAHHDKPMDLCPKCVATWLRASRLLDTPEEGKNG